MRPASALAVILRNGASRHRRANYQYSAVVAHHRIKKIQAVWKLEPHVCTLPGRFSMSINIAAKFCVACVGQRLKCRASFSLSAGDGGAYVV